MDDLCARVSVAKPSVQLRNMSCKLRNALENPSVEMENWDNPRYLGTWENATLHWDTSSLGGTCPATPKFYPQPQAGRTSWVFLQLETTALGRVQGSLAPCPSSRPHFSYHHPSLQFPYDWAHAAPALTREQTFPMQICQKRFGDWSMLGLGWKPSLSLSRDDHRLGSCVCSCLPAELLC